MTMPEQRDIDKITTALEAFNLWLREAVIRTDSVNSFNSFIRSVVAAEGGRLILDAPHGTKDPNRLEMGYVSQSYRRMVES